MSEGHAIAAMGEDHRWDAPCWFPHWQAEHAACRESAMLLDMYVIVRGLICVCLEDYYSKLLLH